MDSFDVVIVGTGTAGVAAAMQATAAGKSFAIAEEWLVGGLCNTRGCIPTKTLLRSARAVLDVRNAARFGVTAGEPEVDFAAVMDRARQVSGERARGVEDWLPTIGTLLRGSAEVVKPGVIRVGETEVGYERLVFANGSAPFVPPVETAQVPASLLERFATTQPAEPLPCLLRWLSPLTSGSAVSTLREGR